MNTFNNTIATKLLYTSIRSAIFIDEKLALPYSDETDESGICKDLYANFQERGCSLSFHKFISSDIIAKDKIKLLASNDLLLLDWELEETEPKYSKSLEVLNTAIDIEGLHFICIYTNSPSNQSTDVAYKICSFFSGNTSDKIELGINKISEIITNEGDTLWDFCSLPNQKVLFKELTLYPDKARELNSQISKTIQKILSPNDYKLFRTILKDFFASKLEYLGFALNEELQGNTLRIVKPCTIIIEEQSYICLLVNNTLIFALNRKESTTEKLYDYFSQAIAQSYSFPVFMGMEIRSKLWMNNVFGIGHIDKINDEAFFYHRSRIKEEFIDFLKDIFIHQINPLITELTTFENMDSYIASNNISVRKNTEINKDIQFIEQLGEMNYYYNHSPYRGKDHRIRLGDIFLAEDMASKEKIYLLCITPLCDCSHPQKIDNLFLFVKSTCKQKCNSASLLQPESDNCSFLKDEDGGVSRIDWKTKAFTIYIPPCCNSIKKQTSNIHIKDKNYTMKYLMSIKENYAQRIANMCSSDSSRVGVSFASLRDL